MTTLNTARDTNARAAELRPCGEYLLTCEDLADLLRVSRRTVWRWTAQGRLPPPVRYSKTCVRWRGGDVQTYLRRLPAGIAAAPPAAPPTPAPDRPARPRPAPPQVAARPSTAADVLRRYGLA